MARAQVLCEQMEIALGGGDLRVPEHHRQPHDVPSLAEVVRRERVAETMPAERRQAKLVLQDVRAAQAVSLVPCRAFTRREQQLASRTLSRSNTFVAKEHLSKLKQKRNTPLFAPLPKHRDQQVVEVHVRRAKGQRFV